MRYTAALWLAGPHTQCCRWEEFLRELDSGKMVLAPWCQTVESEEWVKQQTGPKAEDEQAAQTSAQEGEQEAVKLTGAAKTLCIPFEQPPMPEGMCHTTLLLCTVWCVCVLIACGDGAGQLCFTGNGEVATAWTLWGRSY